MGAMSASIKIKERRQGTCSRRVEVSRKQSDDLDSYHSHHHFGPPTGPLSHKTDIQSKKEKKIPAESRDDALLKSVVFSSIGLKSDCESKGRVDSSSSRKQASGGASGGASGSRTKTSSLGGSSLEEGKSGRRKAERSIVSQSEKCACASKLVQTSSSITRSVSHRSIAIGVSDTDIRVLDKLQSKPISKSQRRCSPQISRRRTRASPVPDSLLTSKSGASTTGASTSGATVARSHSRTESASGSGVQAALEAPLASYRHARCMADHTFSSPSKRVSPANKKNKSETPSGVNKGKLPIQR